MKEKEIIKEGYKITGLNTWSLFMFKHASIHYQPGIKVTAPRFLAEHGYCLTYFATLEGAKRFIQASNLLTYKLWKVRAYNPVELPPRLWTETMDYLGVFPYNPEVVLAGWPTGTRMAKELQLIELVEI